MKKKIAVYPGSFNPWHDGHTDIVLKALQVFDLIVVVQGINPEKEIPLRPMIPSNIKRIIAGKFEGLFANYIKDNKDYYSAVIRGLRNGQDFEFEKTQQYWNEDLGLIIPTVYFICDRSLTHISSSAIRMINNFKSKEKV